MIHLNVYAVDIKKKEECSKHSSFFLYAYIRKRLHTLFQSLPGCEKFHKLARPTNCEEYHKHIIFTIVNYFTKLDCHLLPKEYMVDVGIVGKFYQ